MDRGWWWKFGLIVAVTLGCIWFLIPTYYSLVVLDREQRNNLAVLEERMPAWAPPAKYRLNLGLDLQGGIHMVMRVDTKTALQKRTERRAQQIVNYVNDKKLGEVSADTDPEKLEVTLTAKDPGTMDAIQKEVLATFTDFKEVSRSGASLTLVQDESQANVFRTEAVDQAMLVIRRRIDKWGVAEVDVRKLGADSIQISLPGRSNPEQAKELVGTTAQLEFRMVDDSNPQFFAQLLQATPPPAGSEITLTTEGGFPQLQAPTREAITEYTKDKVPENRVVLTECIANPVKKNECTSYRSYLLDKNVPLTGESLASADANISQLNEPEVNISFDPAGAREFERLTEQGVGRRMAIVLDENVQTAPNINEKISGGSARITMGRMGGRTFEEWLGEAQTLALVLKAGALPAPVTVGEIRQVGASLGDELIRKGGMAAVLGLGLVILFMAIYYRASGLIADLALVLNGLLILAGLAFFNATLTLPGIAGFVLTLGVAVDANVLINERIREELGHGKSARAAVDQGYDRAFWTIFDSHVTALISAFILFFTGTGPVRGFATTLIIGLLASLFTSITVTRVIMTYFVHGRNAKVVSV
ncbi:protein-export membrane protein SecD [Myxococcus xanthus DK 1622]|uniref:Protein translocase subunit SecD n=1 Tax=Myxococcus xanthus (strain DK1622) TaxID=246197 RepID=Q1D3B6_MYXXD|nr:MULTISPECIES: protein translocase subunit SecD [Myxococcus]ABF91859.1 protein-export membrane protein SecD [Myxococcus xanthus DK 1622]NOJ56810.1 protein translocase subunit SecD [Myxococcus xanthus]QPM77248.1 protein translocase subunit SecD [Myxococcus xanthus]QVW66317.1 protein translocase subunit SecD [Myxococcus xanthus DZ2]QZZ52369.1 Protein translocase subunit SecD [Myxococcus xanthus]